MSTPESGTSGNYLARARELVASNVPAAVVTVVRGDGMGAKLLVTDDSAEGTVGPPELDAVAIDTAREAIGTRKSGLSTLAPGIDVFIDVFPLQPLLILIGAVHIAQAVVQYASPLGFRIVVADAREALATRERFPTVDQILVAWPEEVYGQLPISSTTAIVILTHDPKFDEPAILGALQTDAGYIGAVGSRKTNLDRRTRLLEAGATLDQIEGVHGPIGLDIGGKSPEEMAISILGEIIAVRHGRSGGSLHATSGSIRGTGD